MRRPSKRYLRQVDICRMLGVSRITAWKWKRKGEWIQAPPIRIGGWEAWRVEEVHEWLESKRAAAK